MDRQVAGRDPKVADLLDKFVCVRYVQANGLDLALYQFDYNLTWAVMYFNADRTIYGRYGTRSQHDPTTGISIEAFRKSMEAVLELHQGYPANRAALKGKTGPAPRHPTPEGYPTLKRFYTPAVTAGKPDSCLHCHQITNNEYRFYKDQKKPIPDDVLWAFPMPDALGLSLDPKEKATVAAVAPGSPAQKDGFQAGDEIATLEGQPVVSIADVQWVLEHAKATSLKAEVKRGGAAKAMDVSLPAGWRRKGDFSWRGSTEIVSPLPEGSEDLDADERKMLGLSATAIATRVKWPAKGFQKDDVIVEVEGRRSGLTVSDFVAYANQKKQPGDKIPVTVLRAGKEVKLQVEVRYNQ